MITPIDIFILIGILILLIWCGLQEYAITNMVKDAERRERSALRLDQSDLSKDVIELNEIEEWPE